MVIAVLAHIIKILHESGQQADGHAIMIAQNLHCVSHQHANTITCNQQVVPSRINPKPMVTFCELTARRSFAKSDEGSTVPKKMDLNWFIPALVNSRVGSDKGTTGEEATRGT